MAILWVMLCGDLLKAVILQQLLLYHHKPTLLYSTLSWVILLVLHWDWQKYTKGCFTWAGELKMSLF